MLLQIIDPEIEMIVISRLVPRGMTMAPGSEGANRETGKEIVIESLIVNEIAITIGETIDVLVDTGTDQ
jgi:hypothetical protein